MVESIESNTHPSHATPRTTLWYRESCRQEDSDCAAPEVRIAGKKASYAIAKWLSILRSRRDAAHSAQGPNQHRSRQPRCQGMRPAPRRLFYSLAALLDDQIGRRQAVREHQIALRGAVQTGVAPRGEPQIQLMERHRGRGVAVGHPILVVVGREFRKMQARRAAAQPGPDGTQHPHLMVIQRVRKDRGRRRELDQLPFPVEIAVRRTKHPCAAYRLTSKAG